MSSILPALAMLVLAASCGHKGTSVRAPSEQLHAGSAAAVDVADAASTKPPDDPGLPDPATGEPADASPDEGPETGDAAAEASDGKLVATPMEGPYAKLDEMCPSCKKVAKPKKKPKPPSIEVALLSHEWGSPAPGDKMNTSYHLGVRTGEGWFLSRYLGTDGELCGGDSLFWVSFDFVSLEMMDLVPGDPDEIVLWFSESANDIDDEQIMICGVGPSGKPSCFGPAIAVRNDGYGYSGSFESTVAFHDDGSIEFVSKDGSSKGPIFIAFP